MTTATGRRTETMEIKMEVCSAFSQWSDSGGSLIPSWPLNPVKAVCLSLIKCITIVLWLHTYLVRCITMIVLLGSEALRPSWSKDGV